MTPARMMSSLVVALVCGIAGTAVLTAQTIGLGVRVERLLDAPIIRPDLHPSIGENIQGPSLIRVPDWVEDRLGAYYLYFADHKGRYIRLAYADAVLGPWHIHQAGSLQIADSHFLTEPPAVSPEEAGTPARGTGRTECRHLTRSAHRGHDAAHRVAGRARR